MGESFASRIRRTTDHKTGIVEYAFTRCDLKTADDVRDFFKAFALSLDQIPAPRDVIVCLDEFTVAPAVREIYGEVRAKVAKAYYRYSARYSGTTATRIATMSSAVMYKVDGMVYASRELAVAAILAARKNAY